MAIQAIAENNEEYKPIYKEITEEDIKIINDELYTFENFSLDEILKEKKLLSSNLDVNFYFI
jgi:hypothetical protein